MGLRMACEASDLVTSVVSLAGSTFEEASTCAPAERPVSVLLMHGDADATIPYDGSEAPGFRFPGALETAARFASVADCAATGASLPNRDLLHNIDGDESEILSYGDCGDDVTVELWSMIGAPHVPLGFRPSTLDAMSGWVLDHPRG